jgi:lipopolysaccharide heptosyltransferase II
MSEDPTIGSVLLLRLSSVGDIVLTEPVVAALRDALPEATIGYAVKAKYADLVLSNPALDRVHMLAEGRGTLSSLMREVRDAGYSAVVDLHRNLRTARIASAAGARVRASYRKRELADTVRVRLLRRPFRASKLLVRRYLDALAPLGIDAPTRRPRLFVGEGDAERGAALVTQVGLGGGEYAAIVPGSVWATKRWPAERFAELAAALVSELALPVALLGAAGEGPLCEEVARAAGSGVLNLAGGATLGETAAIISRARLYVGNDSGPTHMARALGVPTVALFGPTDPGQFDLSQHALVYRDLTCSACSFYGGNRCPLGHWKCMLEIEVDEVFEAVEGLLGRDPIGAAGKRDQDGRGTAADEAARRPGGSGAQGRTGDKAVSG